MPKVSFVMPVRNGEIFIENTVNSMLSQTFNDLEVIAVNDHSTDRTLDILLSISEKDKRLHVINMEDKEGVANARNLGTKSSNGEIILPSDSDDPNFASRAEVSINRLSANNADIFYGNLERYYVDTGERVLRHFQQYDAKLLRNINIIAHAGCSAYYRYVFDKVGGYEPEIKIGEDYDFWLKAQEAGFKFYSENIPLAQYTMHPSQVTASDDAQKIKKRQDWNAEVRKRHGILAVDLAYVEKHAAPEVEEFYIKKNYDIWFAPESLPSKD